MVKTLADAPSLELPVPAFRHDTDPFAEVRRQSWLVRNALGGGTVISREHVHLLLADRRLRNSVVEFIELQGVTDGILHRHLARSLLVLEGQDHQRLRSLVNRSFTPRAVERHRAAIEQVVAALVEPLAGHSGTDLVKTVAEPLPIQVISHVLGVPPADHTEFGRWTSAAALALSLELGARRDEAEAGMAALDAYVADLIADRRRDLGDDLVSDLVRAEEAGDRLNDDELRTLVIGLLFAGTDTTRNQLALLVWTFAHHPEQWARLAAEPHRAPQAVEEGMRVAGVVGNAPRFVTETFELDGYRLEAGTLLMLSLWAANRDPELPFDITAERQPNVSFGGGAHYCLGASLARAELQVALAALAPATPDLRLDGEPTWPAAAGGIYGPTSLPISWGPTAPAGA